MDAHRPSTNTLRGHWLAAARAAWVVIVGVTLAVLVALIPLNIRDIGNDRLVDHSFAAVSLLLPRPSYAMYVLALRYAAALVFLVTAGVIFWRMSDDGMAVFVSFTLAMLPVGLGLTGPVGFDSYPDPWAGPLQLAGNVLGILGPVCFVTLFYLLPDARPAPRWMRLAAAASAALLASTLLLLLFGSAAWIRTLTAVTVAAAAGAAVVGQIYRYRHASDPAQRQQMKLIALGLTLQPLWIAPSFFAGAVAGTRYDALYSLSRLHLQALIPTLIPLTLAFSTLRYRLWDVDTIVNRTVVYSSLAAAVVALYAILIGALGMLLPAQAGFAVGILALAVVALLAPAVRRGVQRAVSQISPPGETQDQSALAARARTPAPGEPASASLAERVGTSPGRGRLLVLARWAWGAIAVLALAFFAANLPTRFEQLRTVCTPADVYCYGQLGPADEAALRRSGLSPTVYAAYVVLLYLGLAAVSWIAAARIARRRPDDRMRALVALGLVMFGATAIFTVESVQPQWRAAAGLLQVMGLGVVVGLFFVFPDGRFVPRWTRVVAALWMGWLLVTGVVVSLDPAPVGDLFWDASGLLFVGAIAAGGYAQVVRYRHVARRVERQQIKWAAVGLAAAVVWNGGLFLYLAFVGPALGQPWPSGLLFELITTTMDVVTSALIPLTLGMALLHHRLNDVDLIIRRILVYGALAGIFVGLYVLAAGVLGALLQASGDLFLSIVATALAALLVQPLHRRLQRAVNQLMYGDGDDPGMALSRLRRRLETTLAFPEALPDIVDTVAHALHLPYVAVAVWEGGEYTLAAEHDSGRDGRLSTIDGDGDALGRCEVLPVIYQAETVGQLIVAPRAPGVPFSPADRRLLAEVADQAGVAAHAARLTAELQRSRQQLVSAREEERRRLRRDLHDGLGPTLASQTLQLDSTLDLLAGDPESGAQPDLEAASARLLELKAQTQAAVADIRRLVYELRPPALDELGLVSALRVHGVRYAGFPGELHIAVEAPPEGLPPLPAAVEVAAYRIALEALSNVVRHAAAHHCTVRLSLADADPAPPWLRLGIVDDGVGLAAEARAGMGLASMRERAEELGGTLVVEPGPAGGTSVVAWLPLPAPGSHAPHGQD